MADTLTFKPDAVFIPADELYEDADGEHVDPDECTPLRFVGDNNSGKAVDRRGKVFAYRVNGEFQSTSGPGEVRLLPDMCVVKMDETEHWPDTVTDYCPRIYGVYVFDRRRHVHCCSIQPSYELHFIGSQYDLADDVDYDDDVLREAIDDKIREGDNGCELYTYWSVRDIDRMLETTIEQGHFPPEGKAGGYATEVDAVTYDDAVSELVEYNGSFGEL